MSEQLIQRGVVGASLQEAPDKSDLRVADAYGPELLVCVHGQSELCSHGFCALKKGTQGAIDAPKKDQPSQMVLIANRYPEGAEQPNELADDGIANGVFEVLFKGLSSVEQLFRQGRLEGEKIPFGRAIFARSVVPNQAVKGPGKIVRGRRVGVWLQPDAHTVWMR